ncbi:MAG: hypothetical protein ABW130_16705 [Candidatus Thiodiazotropha lotti]
MNKPGHPKENRDSHCHKPGQAPFGRTNTTPKFQLLFISVETDKQGQSLFVEASRSLDWNGRAFDINLPIGNQ